MQQLEIKWSEINTIKLFFNFIIIYIFRIAIENIECVYYKMKINITKTTLKCKNAPKFKKVE